MKHKHILLINKKLSSIPVTLLHPDVECINLHCNNLTNVVGLSNLMHLTSLDLSSNKLTSMIGFSGLPLLKSLNLASNYISKVEGISDLLQLKYINLSYNRISSLHGFLDLHGPDSNLQILLLHGNQLENKNHVIACMKGLLSLRHLVLNLNNGCDGEANNKKNQNIYFENLPQLISLDLLNRLEEPVDIDDDLEQITLNSVTSCSGLNEHEVFSAMFETSGSEISPLLSPTSALRESDIEAFITSKQPVDKTNLSDHMLKPVILTESSCKESLKTPNTLNVNSCFNKNPETLAKSSKLVSESFTVSSPSSKVAVKPEETSENDTALIPSFETAMEPIKTLKHPNSIKCKKAVVKPSKVSSDYESSSNQLQTRKVTVKSKKNLYGNRRSAIPVKNCTKQSMKRVEKESLVNILKELEIEREQRWKAEEASKKLVSVIRQMQSRNCEEKSLQQAASATTERLKQALLTEKRTGEVLKNDISVKDNQILSLNEKLSQVNKKFRSSVDSLKISLADANANIAKIQTKTDKEKKDLQNSLRQLAEKHESVCSINQHLKVQLEAFRMQNSIEHNNAKNNCLITDEQFQKALENELKKDEKRHQAEISLLQHQLQSKYSDYLQLENEFREALMIESKRYEDLHEKCRVASDKVGKYETLLSTSGDKEEKFRSMISQMTSVVKEQKLKISETVKSKQELRKCYEKQLSTLQEEINGNKNQNKLSEKLKRENTDLSSKLFALQSVVDGLKEERKLWSRDLAEQGVALSKDRGWLEMKIESLKAEVEALKNSNKRDLDALRIKTKVVEDQTETILRFKEALSLKDKEIRSKLNEQMVEQQQMFQASEDLTNENALLKEENKALVARKQQLKNKLANLEQENSELRESFEKQRLKWLEKGSVIMKLEKQVKHFNENNREKIDQLEKERGNALSAVQLLKDKNNALLASHQEQLKAVDALHKQETQRLLRNKDEEVSRMKAEVDRVETEMKELLRETEIEKKKMEMKVVKLKALFDEVS